MKMTSSSQLKSFLTKPMTVLILAVAVASAGAYAQSASSAPPSPPPATIVTPPAQNTVTVPPTKPPEKAAQDLRRDPPLDQTKLGEPLPRNLWIELSKLINPAVVSITTSTAVRQMPGGGRYQDPLQQFLEEFWGGRGGGAPGGRGRGGFGPAQPRTQQPVTALGTGFIIREDGLIITNNHVVEQADTIKVQLDNTDNKLYEAAVIGRDPRTDIALIKIDAKRTLPVARLGASKDVQVGEFVAAFGNPYGHAHTMTTGIISAIGREIAEINRFPFLQTDASINPGNSGGPLVDTKGYVIGVNTAIDARAQGIGFAIPIDNVKQIVEQLEKDGRIRRGYIGVGIASVNDDIAAQLGMKEAKGVLITQVLRAGPADKAGIKPYDVIYEFAGKPTNNASDLQNAVGDTKIGSKATVKVWRFEENGKRKDLSLSMAIDENPDEIHQAAKPTKQYFGQKAPFDLGFKVSDWTPAIANEFGLDEGLKGPVVTEVDRNSPAGKVGLQPGDVLIDVNRTSVVKAVDVVKQLKKGRNMIRVGRDNMMVIFPLGS